MKIPKATLGKYYVKSIYEKWFEVDYTEKLLNVSDATFIGVDFTKLFVELSFGSYFKADFTKNSYYYLTLLA